MPATQHLALYDQDPDPDEEELRPVLTHWVLPQGSGRRLATQSHSLLTETSDFPPVACVLDSGPCTLINGTLPTPTRLERLHLRFEGSSLYGHFVLLRMRPGSSRWLFGPLEYMPDKFQRGPLVAPLWPTTQSTRV